MAGGEDAEGVELRLAGHKPVPAPAEVILPLALGGVARQVLLRSDSGVRGDLCHATAAAEEVSEALGCAGGRVG